MIYLFLALVLVAALAALSVRRVGPEEQLVVHRFGQVSRTSGPGLAFVAPVVEHATRVDTSPRHRWAATTTRTSDGASAHLRVEYLMRVTDAGRAPDPMEAAVHDAVEDRLRRYVGER